MPKCDKYYAKWKANMAKCSKYHAKCKVTMPKCSKYHAKWQVLVQNCCKYKANGTGKESKKKPKPEAKKQKLFYTPVEICGLENEQCLTALVLQPKVTTTSAAMALRCVGGDGVGDMGREICWCWQLPLTPRSAQRCPANVRYGGCICCAPRGHICSDMGTRASWRWQIRTPTPASERAEDFC